MILSWRGLIHACRGRKEVRKCGILTLPLPLTHGTAFPATRALLGVSMEGTGPLRCRSGVHAEMLKKKLVFCYFVYKLTERRKRRYWVHPFNSERMLKGAFTTMMIELRGDEAKFFDHFRMSIRSFDELVARTSDALRGEETFMRQPVPPLEMVAVTLR